MTEFLQILRDLPTSTFAFIHHPLVAMIALFLFLPVGVHALLCARRALDASARPGCAGWIASGAAFGLLVWLPFLFARPDLAWPICCVALLSAAVVADKMRALMPKNLDRPDSTLEAEFAAQDRRTRIAALEAILAEPGSTPADTLRRLEAEEELRRLQRIL